VSASVCSSKGSEIEYRGVVDQDVDLAPFVQDRPDRSPHVVVCGHVTLEVAYSLWMFVLERLDVLTVGVEAGNAVAVFD
jgi:hypothetical protein